MRTTITSSQATIDALRAEYRDLRARLAPSTAYEMSLGFSAADGKRLNTLDAFFQQEEAMHEPTIRTK